MLAGCLLVQLVGPMPELLTTAVTRVEDKCGHKDPRRCATGTRSEVSVVYEDVCFCDQGDKKTQTGWPAPVKKIRCKDGL